MAGKKRAQADLAVLEAVAAPDASRDDAAAGEVPAKKKKLAMERKKQRKELDKERHRQTAESDAAKPQPPAPEAVEPVNPSPAPAAAAGPGLHMNVFRDLASPEASVRETAAEALVGELRAVQKGYEKGARKGEREAGDGDGPSQMEAEKDDGLDNCAPSVRQGFALGLAVVLESIRSIRVEAIMKLIPNLLEYSSSMKGPEAKDNLLGRLFGFGAIVRSGRVSRQWIREKSSPIVKDFVSEVVELGSKKRYLTEPAVAVILDLVRKLPDEAVLSEVLESPGIQDWFNRADDIGDPDALFLALKLQERTNVQKEIFGKLLPYPFTPDNFFAEQHLKSIASCFKESAFCLPRIHMVGRFDSMTKTKTVKEFISKFQSVEDCLCLVQNLMALFVDEESVTDEPSDQSQTTDENSEIGATEEQGPFGQGNVDLLKSWVVNTISCVLKNIKLTSKGNSDSEMVKCIEEKFQVQTEILKFFAVQGLFSASLGTEVTSFELQEKFKWPKNPISTSLRNECIQQLQFLLEDAQKDEALHVASEAKSNDLGYYFMRFINTVCNIPSVSLFRTLSSNDDNAFKKLLAIESMLSKRFVQLSAIERKAGPGLDSTKMHVMRYLLIQLLLQVLLHPDEYWEAAVDVTICCKKSFPAIAQGKSSQQESEEDGSKESDDEEDSNEEVSLEFMDVLVQTFLSILPHASGPVCFTIEQASVLSVVIRITIRGVFRVFCDDITDTGLLDMLRVVKIDLKGHRQTDSDDEDDGRVDIEDDDDETVMEDAEVGEIDDVADDSGEDTEDDSADEGDADQDDSKEAVSNEAKDGNKGVANKDGDDSDDSDGMDDDAMFRIDPYIARIFKERNLPGSESRQSQLMRFKLRVLTLLDIYLQRNPGQILVLDAYSFLMQAFVKSHGADGSEQFRQRIGGILQRRIFKGKEYPEGNGIEFGKLENLLERALRLASRSRYSAIASVAHNATFWILKIINSMNCSEEQLASVVDKFRSSLNDYDRKKSRLKLGFVKEVVRRNPWIGQELFGFVLQKIESTSAEYRRNQLLELVDCILKSWVGDASEVLMNHLAQLCELIQEILSNIPKNKSRRKEVRNFCVGILQTVMKLNLKEQFQNALNPETHSLCQTQLGTAFAPFKKDSK
ncbi:hypothetical protein HU200_046555 [Digitaria exilis]|uniref:DNA polymerase V n=1 Tax=Digitaria exilis TaxID=1010633 RepID=A0A835EDI6_9POAL|nr:hypothetical protein HU200_046555 [Digitaria exilis]